MTSPEVSVISKRIYGSPNDFCVSEGRRYIDIAHDIFSYCHSKESNSDELKYSADEFDYMLKQESNRRYGVGQLDVKVIENMVANAAVIQNEIHLRKGAQYSDNDLQYLATHELMHACKFLNAAKQPVMSALCLVPPSVIEWEEGLAVFSEYMGGVLLPKRLQSLAMRVLAIDMAEKGADFYEIFDFFRPYATDEDSYCAAQRILRGWAPQNRIVYYKDMTYLKGFIKVRSLVKALSHQHQSRFANVCGQDQSGIFG